MTVTDLIMALQALPEDAVVHLSLPELDYIPVTSVVHEQSTDGPGVALLRIASGNDLIRNLLREEETF